MGSNEMENSFFIRDYVVGVREQDISRNWPFSEKSLQFLVNHGINRVLPSFDASKPTKKRIFFSKYGVSSCEEKSNALVGFIEEESLKVESVLHIDEIVSEVSKKICQISISGDSIEHGEVSGLSSDVLQPVASGAYISTDKPNVNCNKDKCRLILSSTKRFMNKRKRGKRKCKKRSMDEIYAHANHCTLDDLDRIDKLNRGTGPGVTIDIDDQIATKNEGFVDEVNESSNNIGPNNEATLAEMFKKKRPREENESNAAVPGKRRPLVKIKFSGCPPKSEKRKLIALRTCERKIIADSPLQVYHRRCTSMATPHPPHSDVVCHCCCQSATTSLSPTLNDKYGHSTIAPFICCEKPNHYTKKGQLFAIVSNADAELRHIDHIA